MVRFGVILIIEFYIEIHGYVRIVLVVLKVTGDELEWGGNHSQK